MLHAVQYAAEGVGLNVNLGKGKTEFMKWGAAVDATADTLRDIHGAEIPCVPEYTYLGCLVSSQEADIRARVSKAWGVFTRLSKVWKAPLSRAVKVRLFTACVEAVLLYGCESWTLTEKHSSMITKAYHSLLRYALRLKWNVPMRILYAEGRAWQLPQVLSTITYRRQQMAGHVLRHDQPLTLLLQWTPYLHRCRHGARTTLRGDILSTQGVLPGVALEAASDRVQWRHTTLKAVDASENKFWHARDLRRAYAAKDMARVDRHVHNMIVEVLSTQMSPPVLIEQLAEPTFYNHVTRKTFFRARRKVTPATS